MKKKQIILNILLGLVISFGIFSCKPKSNTVAPPTFTINSDAYNFYVVSDVGRNGYFKQKSLADTMGSFSERISPKFIISAGDCFHGLGVRSVQDPIFLTNFENIYTHPNLHCEWYPILGNHEYQGNTQALIDYSQISRRWCMPDRYYSITKKVSDSTMLKIVFIDTPPFVEKYRKETEKYPDACKQDIQKQLVWLEKTLAEAKEKWILVVGHHPIYSIDEKHGDTPELIEKVKPLLQKYKVDAYICGHIHNFQHLQIPDSGFEYFVNSSASLGRPNFENDSTKFTS
ncbi:MAG TPA: metallophosphoesterase, partial [Bacteroidales bacterium]|nr:metallophosphoesterase [Bacteroidales bacterium]